MNLDRIRSLIAQIKEAGEDFETSPAEDETINELETQIGHKLPASYREFLKEFGMTWSPSGAISGIYENDLSQKASGSVLADTNRFREDFNLPRHLIVIQDDDDAPYCLDLSSDADEPPVVCFQLNTGTYKKIADGFEQFFVQWHLEEIIELCDDA